MSKNLETSKEEIEYYITFCKDYRQGDNPEMIVLSTSLLKIFDEILDYLDYFENEIEKKFGGYSRDDEWEKIKTLTLENQNLKLNLKEGFRTSDKKILTVSKVIEAWDKYPRIRDADILSR